MKKQIIIPGILLFMLLISTGNLYAQVLAGWNTYGQSNWGTPGLMPAQTDPNISYVGFTKGSGLTGSGSAGGNLWGANGWGASAAAAIQGNKFFTFSLTPDAGYEMSLSSIDPFLFRLSATGPIKCLIQYSVGGGTFVDITTHATARPGSTSNRNFPLTDLSVINDLQQIPSGTTVVFRFIPYEVTGATGTWYIGQQNSTTHLAVNGTVSVAGPSVCAITPGTVNSNSGSVFCDSGRATLSLSGTAPATGVDYQWKVSPDGIGNWMLTGGNADTLETGTLTETAYYKCIISCAGSSDADSTPVFELEVNKTSFATEDLSICSNQLPYSWRNKLVLTGGTEAAKDTLPNGNSAGCDSIITLNLSVRQPSASTEDIEICSYQLPYTWRNKQVISGGIAIAHDTLLNANADGCDSVISLNLTVNAASDSTVEITVCNDEFPYTWNGVIVTQPGNGAATYVTQGALGCDSIATLNLKAEENQTPVVYVTATPGEEIQSGTPVELAAWIDKAGSTPGVQWYKNNIPVGNNSIAYKDNEPADNDSFYCVVYSSLRCSDPDSVVSDVVVIRVGQPSGVTGPVNGSSLIRLYPNPNNGVFILEGTVADNTASVTIINQTGQVVYQNPEQDAPGGRLYIQISQSLPAGMYLVHVASGGQTEALRFVITK